MQYQNATIGALLEKISYNNQGAYTAIIERAFQFAKEKTAGMVREGNRPLIEHLLNTAQVLAELGADEETIAAALIHDTKLLGNTKTEEIEKEFGKGIAELIEELSKIVDIEKKNFELTDHTTLSTVILAAAKDIRSVIIEIAGRIEILRNSSGIPREKQLKLAYSSLKVFAPICHKLGLGRLSWEMEDLALKIISPQEYKKIKEKLCIKREVREKEIEQIKEEIAVLLKENGFNEAVQARAKNVYAIYKKLNSGKKFSEITDLRGIRIICNSIKECYETLGIIHTNYMPVTNSFQDYIANTKQSGYKSIHTCIYWNRKIAEVQIRTWEMHYEAETGASAHWKYKKFEQDKQFDKKLSWANQLVEWQETYPNSKDFLKSLKIDFGEEQIVVFTPKKQIVVLPTQSTPIDFAFAVHSDLGLKCKQAKVNSHIVPLNHPLEGGDTIEIITDTNTSPKRQWLNFARSQKARAKIRKVLGMHSQTLTVEGKPKKTGTPTISDQGVKIASCCNPLPGDKIIGYRTTKRKISVHRTDCQNTKPLLKEKLVEIEWESGREQYQAAIIVRGRDRAGLLNDILNRLAENQAVINTTNIRVTKNNIANCEFSLRIRNTSHLEKILKEIERVNDVYSVSRK